MKDSPLPWKLKKVSSRNFGIFDSNDQPVLGEEVLFHLIEIKNNQNELLEAAKTIFKSWKALHEKTGGMAPNTLYSLLEEAIKKAESNGK